MKSAENLVGLAGLVEAFRHASPKPEKGGPDFMSLSIHGMPQQRPRGRDAETKATPPGPIATPGRAAAPLRSPPPSAPPRLHSVWPVHPSRDDPADEPSGAEPKDERKAKPVEIQIELEAAA